jgi:hypothetical protein
MSLQKGILIKDGADIKAKHVCAGDISVSTIQKYVDVLQAKYPSYTIQLFESDEDTDFVNAVVNSPIVE